MGYLYAIMHVIKPLVWRPVEGLKDEYVAQTPFGVARLSGGWRGNQWALDLPWFTVGLIGRPTFETAKEYAGSSYLSHMQGWLEPLAKRRESQPQPGSE